MRPGPPHSFSPLSPSHGNMHSDFGCASAWACGGIACQGDKAKPRSNVRRDEANPPSDIEERGAEQSPGLPAGRLASPRAAVRVSLVQ